MAEDVEKIPELLCYYHSTDLDGHCSGGIVRSKFPKCKMVGIDYSDDINTDCINRNTIVYMVDFSAKEEVMKEIKEKALDFVWIDHHKSAINKYEYLNLRGKRDPNFAACLLTWKYCYSGINIPNSVKYLSDYDIWNHEDPNVVRFQYGLKCEDTSPDSALFWNGIFSDTYNKKIINRGEAILKYITNEYDSLLKYSFDVQFENCNCLCLNTLNGNAKIFQSKKDLDKYDILICYGKISKSKWKVSLYSNKEEVDVSLICIKYGGGGHKAASGFCCKKLPFKIIV